MMPKIRTVKPELFSHEGLFEAEMDYHLPLRLAFIGLFTCCDREGRFRWQPRRLKRDLLPYDDLDLSLVLDALAEGGFIKKYQHEDEYYGCIPSWSKHQYINHREIESVIPSPQNLRANPLENSKINNPLKIESASGNNASLTREARVPDASRVCPGGRERNGRELEGNGTGNGRERNNSLVESETRRRKGDSPVQKIFEHWQHLMHHPNARLDGKRKATIEKALSFGYTAEQLCNAITGCSYTPHNMGDNVRGQRFDGLQIILRDADQIDRFMHNFDYPPHPLSENEKQSQANRETLEEWISETLLEAADANL